MFSGLPFLTVVVLLPLFGPEGRQNQQEMLNENKKRLRFIERSLILHIIEMLEGCRQIMDEVLTTDEQSRQITKLQDQAVGLAQRIRGLVNENARTQMTENEFTPEYDRLVSQYENLAAKTAVIQREKEDKEYRAKRMSLFMRSWPGRRSAWSSIWLYSLHLYRG